MRQVPLWFPLSLACFFALFGTVLLPDVRLLAFSPFLAFMYNRLSFKASLWVASLCGLAIDVLSSEYRIGIHALNYCLTTLLLHKQKRHFFEDKSLSLSLFALLVSVVSTALQLLLIAIFERPLPLSTKLLLTDFALLPIIDAVYAFFCFSCPLMLYLHIKKVGWKPFCSAFFKRLRLFSKNKSTSKSA